MFKRKTELEKDGVVCVGVGRVSVTHGDKRIPNLHFVLLREKSGVNHALNLEFGTVVSCGTAVEVSARLVVMLMDYVDHVMEKGGMELLTKCADIYANGDYWSMYSNMRFRLDNCGRDLTDEVKEEVARITEERRIVDRIVCSEMREAA